MTENNNEQNFGDQLASAREKQGLTTQEVANQLNLQLRTIEQIESSEVDSLPPPSFTRGYIRSFAKLVKIDSEPLIDLYNEVSPGDPELVSASALAPEAQSDHPLIRWTSIVIVVIILALLGFWMFGPENGNGETVDYDTIENAEQTSETTESNDKTAVVVNSQIELSSEESNEPVEQQSEDIPNSLSIEPQTFPENIAVESSVEIVEIADLENENGVLVENEDENELNSVQETQLAQADSGEANTVFINNDTIEVTAPDEQLESTVVPSSEATTEPVENEEIVGDDVIRMSTSSETWVEVVDANGIRLIYDMLSSTRERAMRGTAPFQIFLGNTPDVAIFVNGTKIETPSYNSISKTSRFLVDADGEFIRP
ncbi:MAG: RodZ domain-containing protein [Pseudomonadota bacterium]